MYQTQAFRHTDSDRCTCRHADAGTQTQARKRRHADTITQTQAHRYILAGTYMRIYPEIYV